MNSEIVIIEDDLISGKILMKSFNNIGYQNIQFFNESRDFLKYILTPDAVLPKVIIMDYHMPFLTGFHIMAYLKRNPLYADIKVIFYSGSANESEKRTSLKAGALDFVEKNYKPKVLEKFILQVIDLVETGVYKPKPEFVE